MPTTYGYIISDTPGELISAAVGVGFQRYLWRDHGILRKVQQEEAEKAIIRMLEEAFETRMAGGHKDRFCRTSRR